MSQQQLAQVLGLSQQSINKYENHKVEPDIATLIGMAQFFGISVDELIGNDPQPLPCSAEERRLLSAYRSLSDAEKRCVRTVIRTLRSKQTGT